MKKKELPSVLFAADTQASLSYIKRSVTKLQLLVGEETKKGETWQMVAASSGDALVVDEALSTIRSLLYNKIKPDEKNPSFALRSLRSEIGDTAYATYQKYKERGAENPEFQILLGTAAEYSEILHVTYEGKNEMLGRYGILGSGQVTGGELLLTEFLREEPTEDQAASLAALVIATVG